MPPVDPMQQVSGAAPSHCSMDIQTDLEPREYATELDDPITSRLFTCQYLGCQKRFRRKADLERHVRGTHLKSKPHVCPAVGCFKKERPNSFPRRDKLVDHLLAMHDHRMLCVCPSDDCDQTPRRADEVYVHLRLAHISGQCPNYIRDILQRLCDPERRLIPCPVSTCKSAVLFDRLPDHVLEHDRRDIGSAMKSLEASNFVAVKEGCIHSRLIGEQVSCPCPFTAVRLRCPACSLAVDCQEFGHHIVETHFIHPNEVEHFKIWEAHCKSMGIETKHWRYSWRNSRRHTVSCPVCSWQSDSDELRHHIDMRGDLSHLKPHRMEIFRFYQYFLFDSAWTSIWEDLKQPFGPPVTDAAGPSTTQQEDELSSSG